MSVVWKEVNMLIEIDRNEDKKWDSIVKSFANYDVYYLNAYVKAFEKMGDGIPVLFYYENEKGQRAINVVFKRDIEKTEQFKGKIEPEKWYDLCSPYGYGGFWSDSCLPVELVKEYDEYCRQKGYISEFVRFELFSEYEKIYDGVVESHTHNVVRFLNMPIEEMLMDFEHKVRKNLKRAEKNNLRIYVDETGERLEDFLKIYYGTMDRNHAKDNFYFKKEFFETINTMQGNFAYFHVLYENKIISTELVINGSEYCYSYLGGTDKEYFPLRPNEFLKFEVIKWAKKKGMKAFVLGGGYGADDGIFQYKKALAPNGVVDFYIGKKIFDQNKYDELVKLRGVELENNFFPLYRS